MTTTADELLAADALARHLGIELLSYGPGHAEAALTIAPSHLNGGRRLHGATTMALADFAFSAALLGGGHEGTGVQVSISYFRPVRDGRVTAHAREVSRGAQVAHYRVEVTDQRGRLIATMQATAFVSKRVLGAGPRGEAGRD